MIHRRSAPLSVALIAALIPPNSGSSSECKAVDRDLIIAIAQDPANYYVNVHNTDYPAGAIRGQLG